MAAKTLLQEAIEIANSNSGKSRTRQLQELLVPKNSEMEIKNVKWKERISAW
jgi:hypothetical protein